MVGFKFKTGDEIDFRYELKYQLSKSDLEDFYLWLLANNHSFKRAYANRYINNVYFDSRFLDAYQENESGTAVRTKLRIRWYGDFEYVELPVLELKRKFGLLGYKDSYQFKSNDFEEVSDLLDMRKLKKKCPDQLLPYLIKYNSPVLMNRYSREYYVNNDNIRITIDNNIGYTRNLRRALVDCDIYSVLEVKFLEEDYDRAQSILKTLPFIVGRNSKYSNGLEKIDYV